MGHGKYIPGLDGNEIRRWQHKALFSSIHEARVEELHLSKGTISISLLDASYSDEIEIPVISLSTSLPGNNETTVDAYGKSSWGRYIPQVGDIIRVGFSSRGKIFALGYGAPFYAAFDYADKARESRGGIGWGETSGKDLKPGDWDFRSSRGSTFYLGGKAKLASGGLSLTLDKPANQIAQSASLNNTQAGYSYSNFGEVRRFVLPTDTEKSVVYSLRPTVGIVPFDPGKEFNVSVRGTGSIPNPYGTEIASFSVGDVIDDSLPSPILMVSTGGGGVKWFRNVQNVSGLVSAFSEKVDDLGNYEVLSLSGTMFTWTTTSATWNITNLGTTITSSSSFSVTSPTIDMNGMTNLGSSTATDFIIKGTTHVANLNSLCTSTLAALATLNTSLGTASGLAVDEGAAAAITALVTALGALTRAITSFSGSLQGDLSTTVKTI